MRGVLIDNDDTVAGLSDDVILVELRTGNAKRVIGKMLGQGLGNGSAQGAVEQEGRLRFGKALWRRSREACVDRLSRGAGRMAPGKR